MVLKDYYFQEKYKENHKKFIKKNAKKNTLWLFIRYSKLYSISLVQERNPIEKVFYSLLYFKKKIDLLNVEFKIR